MDLRLREFLSDGVPLAATVLGSEAATNQHVNFKKSLANHQHGWLADFVFYSPFEKQTCESCNLFTELCNSLTHELSELCIKNK